MSYHLEIYHGKATRHESPSCHTPQSFTYYVDENNQPLDLTCGRCDRESFCGYHYTPRQFFHDHENQMPPRLTLRICWLKS